MRIVFALIFFCAGLYSQENIDLEKAEALYSKGKKAYYEGNYPFASSVIDSALSLAYLIEPLPEKLIVSAEHRMANLYIKLKNYQAAEKHLDKALSFASEVYGAESKRVAGIYNDYGNLYASWHKYSKSSEWYGKSIELRKLLYGENSVEEAYTKMNRAMNFYSLGNYSKCLDEFYKVLQIYKSELDPDDENFNRVYNSMSNAYRKKGDVENAVEFASKALEIKLKNYDDQHPSVAKYYENLAKALVEVGKIEEAKKYFEKARLIIEKKGDSKDLGNFINDAARVYLANYEIQEAYDEYIQAEKILSHDNKLDYGVNYNLAKCRYELGQRERAYRDMKALAEVKNTSQINLRLSKWAYELGLEEEAWKYVREGRTLINEGDDFSKLRYLVHEARLLSRDSVNVAMSRISEAISGLVQLRREYSGRESKQFINEGLEHIFDLAVEISLSKYEKNTRSEEAFEDLYRIVEQAKAASFWDNYSEDNANFYGGVPAELLEEIEILKEGGLEMKPELETALSHLEKDYPNYFAKKYDLQVPALQNVKITLDSEMAILDYYVTTDEILCLLLSKDENKLIRYPNSKEVTFTNELQDLSKDISRISIIPHKFIHFIAFDGIRHPETKRYLLYDYAFSYQVNVQGLMTQTSEMRDENYLGFAPQWSDNIGERNGSRDALVALPGAMNEVKQVADLMGGAYYGKTDASEALFYKKAPDADLLHFATHAQVDPENDLNSVLYLHAANKEEDGMLEMDEIMSTPLDASLVILSACETGTGGLMEGEGVMSLARAFQYAGAKSVLMSLWRANDQSAQPIIYEFIKNYKDGVPKDVALQASKIKYLESSDPLLREEFYWAGFMICGDVSNQNGRFSILNYFLIGLGTLLLVFAVVRVVKV